MKKHSIFGFVAAVAMATAIMAVPVMANASVLAPAGQIAMNPAAAQGITKDQALVIALKQAGLAKKDVSYINVHQDYEDGRPCFDVKFYVGMTEYHYDVDIATGQIFDADIDREDFDMDYDWD